MSLDFLRRNLGLKIFSLILAIFMWAYVKYTSTPYASLSSEAKLTVALAKEGIQENLVALNVPGQVSVTVRGDSTKLALLGPNHFKAVLDMDNRKPGVYSVAVSVTAPPDVKVVRMDPERVTVRLDPLEKRLFPVKIEPRGTIATGFILGKLSTQPESVLVAGAQSVISRVKEVRAVCDIEGADMDRVQRISVDVVDEDGKLIEGLKAEPASIRATLPVRHEVINATVPISAGITGSPAKGYRIARIVISPPTATIQYPYSLQPPPAMIKTQEISIEGTNSSIAREIGVAAPRDVSLVDPQSVKIHIMIAPAREP
jgi:YbbR domain-containing protein